MNTEWAMPSGPPPRDKRRWWPVVVAVIVVVIATAVTVVVVGNKGSRTGADQLPPIVSGQVLLSPVRSKPVPGWRTDMSSLISDAKVAPRPRLFSSIRDRAFFVATSEEGIDNFRHWLVALDVTSGRPLFHPIEISGYGTLQCYLNGPSRIVCMNYSVNSKSTDSDNIPTQVWVVDAVSGRIVANSLTELRPSESVAAPHIGVQQVGDYLVALLPGVGWRGVGENGELTWQVSGEGRTLRTVDRRYFPGDPAVPIGVGNTGGASAVAFSAVDGKEFSSDGGEWIDPIVGGFVVSGPSIRFFDEKGVKRGEFKSDKNASWEPASNGQLAIMSVSDIVGSGVKQVVFNSSGTKIAELNTHSLGSSIRVIGDYIFTGSDNEKDGPAVWKKFSLRSGKAISECSGIGLSRSSFVGSDGTVVIGKIDSPVSSDRDIVRAVDSNSCEPVWEVEGHPALTAVNETLIQTSESEVFSLVSS